MNIALVFCSIDMIFDRYPSGAFSLYESNPPMGIGGLGTVVQELGHKVKIFDQKLIGLNDEELAKEIIDFNPEVVAFSCTSLNLSKSEKCLNYILAMNEDCFTIVGGIHPTLCPDEIMEKKLYDVLIAGEGEEVFYNVIKQLDMHGEIRDTDITGLWLRDKSSKKGVAVLSSINQKIVNRELLEIHNYKNKGALLEETPCYSMFTSRGCPFTCKFCSKPDYHKIYRTRDIDEVITEIKYLIKECDAKSISFREDNFTVDLEHLKKFCNRMIEEFGGELFWECESRASLSKEILELMYKSGCRGIWCGIETMVPRWQKWIDKCLDKNEVIKFYIDCKEIGIKTGALFMFGFPYQTMEEIEYDIEFAMSLPAEFRFFQCLAIFPGSPLKLFYDETKLCYPITENIFLATIKGKSLEEMLELEKEINNRVSSPRNTYTE